MKDKIRENRTLTELIMGIVCFGVVCQIAGIFFMKDQLAYAVSLWVGILTASGMAVHMNYTIHKALAQDEGTAEKVARSSYFLRYACAMVLLAAVALTGVTNLVVTFVGIMGLKIGAYIQPLMHKLLQRWMEEE